MITCVDDDGENDGDGGDVSIVGVSDVYWDVNGRVFCRRSESNLCDGREMTGRFLSGAYIGDQWKISSFSK